MSGVAVWVSLTLVLGWVPGAATGPALAQETERDQLSAARERLAAIGERLKAAEEQEADAERELADADATLREVEAIVNEVTASVERQRAAVGDAERRLAEVERESRELEEAFGDRIARLYKQGPELSFELLLSSSDADQAIARTVLLERLTEGDQVDLERLSAARVVVASERRRLAVEQRELEQRLLEQQAVLAEAEELRADRALAAADARSRKQRLADEHDDLETEEARLEKLVRQRQEEERQRRTAANQTGTGQGSGPTAGASGYAWPLCAPVTSGYGPRWGRMHRGVDQGASTGTAIGAAKAGRVIFAGWQGGYGNLTLVDHGDAVTAYAHQSSFAVREGAQVSRGQTIGYVGSTGNSTGPHLHLEVRVNGTAVNPRQYLPGSPC